MTVEVRVPTLGESVTEATVATWFKQPGEAVAADEMLCELETDKVTVEVPSPASGKMGEHVAKEGETVGVDALLATIEEGAEAAPAPAESTTPDEPRLKAEPATKPATGRGGNGKDAGKAAAPAAPRRRRRSRSGPLAAPMSRTRPRPRRRWPKRGFRATMCRAPGATAAS